MSAVILYSALLGLGALLAMRALGGSGSTAAQFAALRPARGLPPAESLPPVFSSRALEARVRPGMEFAGERAVRAISRAGISSVRTRERLAAAGDRHGLGLFWGQKIAAGIVCVALPPLAAQFRLAPETPAMVWVGLGILGFVAPDLVLRSKATAERTRMRAELVRFAELLTLAVSAGLGVESAIEEVTATEGGRLFDEVRAATRQGALRSESLAASLAPLPTRLGLPEFEPLVGAITAAAVQGISLSAALHAQVRSLRDRRRAELIASGERAQVRMLLPVGLLILPAFLLVVLYPAAVQLMGLTGH